MNKGLNNKNMDISNYWDQYLEMEDNAIERIEYLSNLLLTEPENKDEIIAEIGAIKDQFASLPYASEIFRQ